MTLQQFREKLADWISGGAVTFHQETAVNAMVEIYKLVAECNDARARAGELAFAVEELEQELAEAQRMLSVEQ